MATNTTNFKFKKPDESDFYSVQDQNGNWDIADKELQKLNEPAFEDYTGDAPVPEAATALAAIKSKGKLGTLLSNIKAFCKGCCTIGMIVNNCVTDNAKLPLSAAQGKALMDLYTKLNSELKLDAHVSFVNFTSGSFGYAVQLVGDFGTASLGWSDTEIYFDRAEAGKWRRVWTINPPAAKV